MIQERERERDRVCVCVYVLKLCRKEDEKSARSEHRVNEKEFHQSQSVYFVSCLRDFEREIRFDINSESVSRL